MEYIELSIRITLPPEISAVIKKEKERFVAEYGSKYKSEPHITLYLARYTKDGLEKLPLDLQQFAYVPFSFTLLGPEVSLREGKNHYVVDVSDKERIEDLHVKISEIASRYQSPLLRQSDQARVEQGIRLEPQPFVPHITLGSVNVDAPQPSLADIRNNLKAIQGKEVTVSDVTAFFYGKETSEEKAKPIKEVKISFPPLS